MHVFIAGIMQAQRLDDQIESQTYRESIATALKSHMPGVIITDPWRLHPNSVNYDAETARQTFLSMMQRAGEVDLLIAYLPQMSMGTAMEMWQAHQAGVYIIAVTPYVHHWAIRFTADEILPDLQTLLGRIESGQLSRLLQRRPKVDGQTGAE